MEKGKLRALKIDKAKLTFRICFSVSPGSSFTSRLAGRPPVAPLGGGGLLSHGRGTEAGVSSDVPGD